MWQEEHELQDSESDAMAVGVPRHWRLRAQQMGSRAFQGLTVCGGRTS